MLNSFSDKDLLDYYKEQDDYERRLHLAFWWKIIEHLTRNRVMYLLYNDEHEIISVEWADKHLTRLAINVCGDDIKACTRDVIEQTQTWLKGEKAYV